MILFDLINICSNFNYFGDYSANQHPQICNIEEKHNNTSTEQSNEKRKTETYRELIKQDYNK